MKDIHKMRLAVLRELKNARKFFDSIERSVKSQNPDNIQRAYIFLIHLSNQLEHGLLSPRNIALDTEIAQMLQDEL